MNSPIAIVTLDQNKLPFCNVDDKCLVNEKNTFKQRKFELLDFNKSFESIMLMINQLMQEVTLMFRDANMRNTENYIQQRINEFSKAVDKVIKSIKDIAFWDMALGFSEAALCVTIGGFQLAIRDFANIAATARDALVGMGIHASGAILKREPQIEGELGNKEKTLNDVWHQIEQNARDWFKEASRLFAQLAEVMATLLQQLQNVIGLQRLNG